MFFAKHMISRTKSTQKSPRLSNTSIAAVIKARNLRIANWTEITYRSFPCLTSIFQIKTRLKTVPKPPNKQITTVNSNRTTIRNPEQKTENRKQQKTENGKPKTQIIFTLFPRRVSACRIRRLHVTGESLYDKIKYVVTGDSPRDHTILTSLSNSIPNFDLTLCKMSSLKE